MTPKRTKILDIINAIFGELEEEKSKTITDIKNTTGLHHDTVRNYLELIELIQSKPKLILKRTGHSYQAVIEKREIN